MNFLNAPSSYTVYMCPVLKKELKDDRHRTFPQCFQVVALHVSTFLLSTLKLLIRTAQVKLKKTPHLLNHTAEHGLEQIP